MAREKKCGIYCIENLVNGKKYIGLSRDIDLRFKQHTMKLRGNYHINDHLQSAWNKYKQENFEFSVLEICDEENLKKREIYFIKYYKTKDRQFGYNKTSGGDGTSNKTDEILEKMSKKITRNAVIRLDLNGKYSAEYRNCAKAAESVNGRTENIRNCCNNKFGCKSNYGYMWVYKKDYDINKQYIYEKEILKKSVDQYDLQNNYIATYESAREAEKQTGIGYKMISRVCNGGRPYTHGYIFKFTD